MAPTLNLRSHSISIKMHGSLNMVQPDLSRVHRVKVSVEVRARY